MLDTSTTFSEEINHNIWRNSEIKKSSKTPRMPRKIQVGPKKDKDKKNEEKHK